VDARLHHLQGKAELVKSTERLALLKEFYRDKLSLRERHAAVARFVANYNFNNAYQYVIAREDVQLDWLRDAIADLGGELDQVPPPDVQHAKGEAAERSLMSADRDAAQAFVEKWRGRIDAMPNARHRSMLRVILGEALEHRRFFEQAVAGRTDLLGRRADGAGTGGGVLSNRWVE
jgi:hypothetical protein